MKREFRLTRAIDFKQVRQAGKSHAHLLAVLIARAGESKISRVGIICTPKVGNAVDRNHVKRQIRAIMQGIMPEFKKPTDILIIARKPAGNVAFTELESAIIELLGRAALIGTNSDLTGR